MTNKCEKSYLSELNEDANTQYRVNINDLSTELTEVESSKIDVAEAFEYFKQLNLPCDSSLDTAANARARWKSNVANWICSVQKLNPDLKSECDLIHAIAQCPFNWEDSTHKRMMHTVYKKLTKTCFDCPQFGSHWQLVGFQGLDPSTDLRGVGMFGLLQMLYLTSHDMTIPLSEKLYKVANSENQPFPLAILSLNITHIVMNTLQSGKFNKECNNRQSVLQVLNLFYAALLNYIYNVWVTECKTIKDSGYLLKDAEKHCCKNIRKILLEVPSQLQQHQL